MFCYNCGTKLEQYGSFCGQCGVSKPIPPKSIPTWLDVPDNPQPRNKLRVLMIVGGLVLMMIVVMTVAANYASDTTQANNTPVPKPVPEQPPVKLAVIPVEDIIRAYKVNGAGADQWLLNKQFIVTGTVNKIRSAMFDEPTVYFDNPEGWGHPQATFINRNDPRIGELRSGDRISLACVGGSSMMDTPMFEKCNFADVAPTQKPTDYSGEESGLPSQSPDAEKQRQPDPDVVRETQKLVAPDSSLHREIEQEGEKPAEPSDGH